MYTLRPFLNANPIIILPHNTALKFLTNASSVVYIDFLVFLLCPAPISHRTLTPGAREPWNSAWFLLWCRVWGGNHARYIIVNITSPALLARCGTKAFPRVVHVLLSGGSVCRLLRSTLAKVRSVSCCICVFVSVWFNLFLFFFNSQAKVLSVPYYMQFVYLFIFI